MSRIKSSNSNYQSLYLLTSFLLGMISLGIIVWNRKSVISAQAGIDLFPELVEGNSRGIGFDKLSHQDNCVSIHQINFPSVASLLALSALTYQQSGNALGGLLVGASSYISAVNAQSMPALTVDLDKLNSTQGAILSGGLYTGVGVYAKDVNNDSYVDLLIGAYGINKVYLMYGPKFNFTNLDSLSGSQGVIFRGSGQYVGFPVYATDLNNDGHIDILIGAYLKAKAYLVYGPNFENATALDSLSGQKGLIFTGGGYTGYSFYTADVNKDGNVDILIGTYSSYVYLVYGPNFSNATDLTTLNGKKGVIFTGASGTGSSVYAQDLNGDKEVDLLIGVLGSGKMYLVYGPDFENKNLLDNLSAPRGVIFNGATNIGSSIYVVDINKDTYPDILVGAYDAGVCYLIYGPNFSNSTMLNNLSDKKGVVFTGYGHYIDVGDVNGDGYLDMVIGAWYVNKVYLVYGPNFSDATVLENLSSKQGVILKGDAYTGIGLHVADINSDDCVDILIGAHHANKAYVVFNQAFGSCVIKTTLTSTLTTTKTSIVLPVTTTPTISPTKIIQTPEISPSTMTLMSDTDMPTTNSVSEASGSSKLPEQKSSNPNNTALYAGIGGAAGGVALLLAGVGLFACYQKRKNKQSSNPSNVVPLSNESMRPQGQSSIYTAAPLMSGKGNSERPSLARSDYVQIDETKKTEKEYDRMPKLEI